MAKSRKPSPKNKPKNHRNSNKRRKIVEQNAKVLKKLKEE